MKSKNSSIFQFGLCNPQHTFLFQSSPCPPFSLPPFFSFSNILFLKFFFFFFLPFSISCLFPAPATRREASRHRPSETHFLFLSFFYLELKGSTLFPVSFTWKGDFFFFPSFCFYSVKRRVVGKSWFCV